MTHIRKWRKVMAVGCSHGDLANKEIKKQVISFRERYKPEIRFELGDVLDTAALRSGAKGTADEGRDLAVDYFAGVEWLKQYEPTHITWGNHDARMCELMDSPNAIVSYAASKLWNGMQDAARALKSKTLDYDFETGWFELGGVFWGHGYWYNESALRDHAEYLGGPTVMAHKHKPEMTPGRTRRWSPSFCVGTLADIPSMRYARRRRQTATWGHGVVFGEISEDRAQLWLAQCEKGQTLKFPL